MALNNILVEPQREITESLIGILVVSAITTVALILSYYAAVWWITYWQFPMDAFRIIINMGAILVTTFVGLVFVFFIGWGLLVTTHEAGDGICNLLAKVGLDPRPKQRYRIENVWDAVNGIYIKKRVAVTC